MARKKRVIKNITTRQFSRLMKNLDKIIADTLNETIDDTKNDIEKIFKRCIDSYYNAYTPKKYKRKYSLRKSYDFEVIIESGKAIVKPYFHSKAFDSSHRVVKKYGDDGREYLFNKILVEGYHGGAVFRENGEPKSNVYGDPHPQPDTEIPYFRKHDYECDEFGRWIKKDIYTKWYDEPAPRSNSIIEDFRKRYKMKLNKGDFVGEFLQKNLNKNLKKYL